MKALTRRGFTAAGILAALSLSPLGNIGLQGCSSGFEPDENEIEAVYGPPEDFEPVGINGTEAEDDPDDYDPEDNELVDVYGPPSDDFDAENNIAPALYGPPPDD